MPSAERLMLRRHNHGIAITEEPVALLDRMSIGTEYIFLSAKSAHQHEQRGFREVEIGDQYIHDTEAIAGRDENVGLTSV